MQAVDFIHKFTFARGHLGLVYAEAEGDVADFTRAVAEKLRITLVNFRGHRYGLSVKDRSYVASQALCLVTDTHLESVDFDLMESYPPLVWYDRIGRTGEVWYPGRVELIGMQNWEGFLTGCLHGIEDVSARGRVDA